MVQPPGSQTVRPCHLGAVFFASQLAPLSMPRPPTLCQPCASAIHSHRVVLHTQAAASLFWRALQWGASVFWLDMVVLFADPSATLQHDVYWTVFGLRFASLPRNVPWRSQRPFAWPPRILIVSVNGLPMPIAVYYYTMNTSHRSKIRGGGVIMPCPPVLELGPLDGALPFCLATLLLCGTSLPD
jgi:hypothetical protein